MLARFPETYVPTFKVIEFAEYKIESGATPDWPDVPENPLIPEYPENPEIPESPE